MAAKVRLSRIKLCLPDKFGLISWGCGLVDYALPLILNSTEVLKLNSGISCTTLIHPLYSCRIVNV